jgi:hypothetical protein
VVDGAVDSTLRKSTAATDSAAFDAAAAGDTTVVSATAGGGRALDSAAGDAAARAIGAGVTSVAVVASLAHTTPACGGGGAASLVLAGDGATATAAAEQAAAALGLGAAPGGGNGVNDSAALLAFAFFGRGGFGVLAVGGAVAHAAVVADSTPLEARASLGRARGRVRDRFVLLALAATVPGTSAADGRG